jgi:hypothetical protein
MIVVPKTFPMPDRATVKLRRGRVISWAEKAYPKLIHYNKLEKRSLRGVGAAGELRIGAPRELQIDPLTSLSKEKRTCSDSFSS